MSTALVPRLSRLPRLAGAAVAALALTASVASAVLTPAAAATTAAAVTEPPAAAAPAPVSPQFFTLNTVCSLRSDPTSDCMAVGFGLGRGRVVAGVSSFNWLALPSGTGYHTFYWTPDTTLCLDVAGDSTAVDAQVVLRSCDNTLSQRWVIRTELSAGPAGAHHPIRNQWSGLHLSFETVGAAPIVQRPFGDRASQYFALLPAA